MHMYIGPIKTWEERSVEEMNGRNVVKRRQSELEINRKSNRQRTQRRGRPKEHKRKQPVLFNDRTGEIFPVYSGPFTHGPTSPPIAYPVIEKAGVFVLRFLVGCLLFLFPVFFELRRTRANGSVCNHLSCSDDARYLSGCDLPGCAFPVHVHLSLSLSLSLPLLSPVSFSFATGSLRSAALTTPTSAAHAGAGCPALCAHASAQGSQPQRFFRVELTATLFSCGAF